MALDTHKILSSDYEGKDIAALPVRPTISAAELQAAFDRLVKEVVVPKFNALIEELAGSLGADAVGKTISGMSGQSAGALLEELAAKKAPIDSPGLTGTPTAPTPDTNANTAQLATTAFVQAVARELVLNTGSADMTKAVYDPQGKNTDVFAFAEEAARHSVLAVNLSTGDWVELADGNYMQTVTAAEAEAADYSYIVAPAPESHAAYGMAGIYMGNVETGKFTFYATAKPETAVLANLMKIHTTGEEA